jgi:hypothetical protein
VALLTAFSLGKRWREMPSLSPLIRFPGYGFSGFSVFTLWTSFTKELQCTR